MHHQHPLQQRQLHRHRVYFPFAHFNFNYAYLPTYDCSDPKIKTSGIRYIQPDPSNLTHLIPVYCDVGTSGAYTVVQRQAKIIYQYRVDLKKPEFCRFLTKKFAKIVFLKVI